MDQVFKSALPILQKLKEAGFESYFVGGAVRDLLLDKPISDVDIATSASPEIVTKLFENVVPIGIEHGTVLVLLEDNKYEVTTFRMEGKYEDYRHPSSVLFVQDISKDLARRDFTINAMAMDENSKIIDPFNGQGDLQKGVIKTVGNPIERFEEDPLRMMRAVRFVSQLGFSLDEEAAKAILKLKPLLNNIAVERITMEFGKLLIQSNVKKGIELFGTLGLNQELPLFQDDEQILQTLKRKGTYPFKAGVTEFIAFIGYEIPNVTPNLWMKKWKLSKEAKQMAQNQINRLKLYDSGQPIELCIYELNPQEVEIFGNLLSRIKSSPQMEKVKVAYQNLPIKSRKELSINGNDLLSLFPTQSPGPWIEQLLKKIESQIVLGKVPNQKSEIKDWIRKWKLHESS